MSRTIARFLRRIGQPLIVGSAALTLACQALVPAAAPRPDLAAGAPAVQAAPSFVLTPEGREAARRRLSGELVSDFVNTLVGAPGRWAENKQPPGDRSLMALGDPVTASWVGGLDIRSAPFLCTGDMATNGFASRHWGGPMPKRVFILTRNGTLLDLDPENPTVGFCKTNLGDTFTKTYLSLSGNGQVAFAISDNGQVFAINVANQLATTPASRSVRSFYLSGSPGIKSAGTALFIDPLQSSFSGAQSLMYACDNNGGGRRIAFTPTAQNLSEALFAAATFQEQGAAVPLSVATPHSGTEKIKSPPVVLGGKLVVGDRAGNLITYDYGAGGTPTRRLVNYGWPIETPVAVDVDDNLNPIDYFAAAGAQLVWMKSDGTVYTGQYALLEKGGNDGLVDTTTFNTYVTTTNAQLTATGNWMAFSSAKSTGSDAVTLPLTNDNPKSLDNDHLSECEFLSGLPPEIWPYMGASGRPFYNYYPWNVGGNTTLSMTPSVTPPGTGTNRNSYPVQDGTDFATAELQGPSSLDFDDDGSAFVADTNHCQVLFKPGNSDSWKNWFPASAMTDAAYNWQAGASKKPDHITADQRFYVMAGTLYPNAPNNDGTWSGADDSDSGAAGYNGKRRDIGNGAAGPNQAGGSVFVNPPQCPANGTTGGTIARGSAINRVQGAAIGELGLYLANRNAFQQGANDNGQILFLPRVGLPAGTYWGITNPQPGRMYVICNFVDPQGMAVWRDPSGTMRDVLFAPSMTLGANSVSAGRVLRLDSATMTPATTINTAGVTLTTGLNNPYDCALDDDGNLFIAENGANRLLMIAKMVPPDDGIYSRTWGVAANPNAGQLYTVRTGMTSIASVTFAANDPQVPSGCLYIALGAAPGTLPHRIIRMDETTTHQSVAGPAYTFPTIPNIGMADSTDSSVGVPILGDAATTRLAIPWRARGDGNGNTYIMDRGNNRIRKLISTSGTSQATGYMSFPYPGGAGPLGKPVYNATLRLYSKSAAGTLEPPQVGLASPFKKDGVMWSNATLTASPGSFTPTKAPDVDLTVGRAQPSYPSSSGAWNFQVSPGGATAPYYEWKLPAQMIFSSATDANHQHLRLGMAAPVDANGYYYPTSQGVLNAPYYKAPDFYTNNGAAANQRPRVDYTYGNIPISYPILSPPAIAYAGATRYVYVVHSNALWRYNVTTPTDFIGANGAADVFTRTSQGRAGGKGTLYTPGTDTFQFNPTAPLIDFNNKVFAVDIWATNATTYSYDISKLDGGLTPGQTNMWLGTSASLATNVVASTADNAGIYLTAGDPYLKTAYLGLSNGRIYRISLE